MRSYYKKKIKAGLNALSRAFGSSELTLPYTPSRGKRKRIKDYDYDDFDDMNASPLRIADDMPFPFSFTKTKTEEEDSSSKQMSINSNSKQFVKVNLPHKKLKRTTGNSILYRDSYAQEISWLSNKSKFVVLNSLGTKQQYNTNANFANAAGHFTVAAFNLNPDQYTTGGVNVLAGQTTSDWVGFSNATCYYDILNNSNMPCFIKMHWYMCKTDTNDNPLSEYAQSVNGNKLYLTDYDASIVGAPLVDGNEVVSLVGGTVDVLNGMDAPAYTNLYSRKDVKTDWKKLKTVTFGLGAGDAHRVTSTHILNQFQSKQRLADKLIFLKGTLTCILEMQGSSSHVTKTGEGAFDGPTIGAGKISVVVTRKVNVKQLKVSQERYDLTYYGLGNVINNAAVVEANVIGDVDMMAEIGKLVN